MSSSYNSFVFKITCTIPSPIRIFFELHFENQEISSKREKCTPCSGECRDDIWYRLHNSSLKGVTWMQREVRYQIAGCPEVEFFASCFVHQQSSYQVDDNEEFYDFQDFCYGFRLCVETFFSAPKDAMHLGHSKFQRKKCFKVKQIFQAIYK